MKRLFEATQRNGAQTYWFNDNRSGCEKQTGYFERMRQLQSELITVEQHNLVNAMQRLEQLTYPRRKPVVLNCSDQSKSGNGLKRSITEQRFVNRLSLRDRQDIGLNIGSLSLCPSPVVVSFRNINKPDRKSHIGSNKRKPKNEPKLFGHLLACDAKTPLSGVFHPCLPCIPNVGHRTHIEEANKLKILELANAEFQTYKDIGSRVSSTRKGVRPPAAITDHIEPDAKLYPAAGPDELRAASIRYSVIKVFPTRVKIHPPEDTSNNISSREQLSKPKTKIVKQRTTDAKETQCKTTGRKSEIATFAKRENGDGNYDDYDNHENDDTVDYPNEGTAPPPTRANSQHKIRSRHGSLHSLTE